MDKRKANLTDENKKIMILVVAILVVILVCYLIISYATNVNTNVEKEKAIKTVISNSETTALYIWNSDAKKCKNCKEIEKYLNSKKIKYISYDVKNYSKDKYEKLLITLGINPSDFGYPAVIYVKDGMMYSNIINISDTKTVETFIKNYELQKLK